MTILKKTWPDLQISYGRGFFRQGKSDQLHSKALTPSVVRLEIGNWKFGRLDVYKLVEKLSDMLWHNIP